MTYFSKNYSEEYLLPDNTVATSIHDVDRFLKANNLASKSDYSDDYLQKIRSDNDKTWRKEIFTEIVQQYKKRIWNERNKRRIK